MQLPLVATLSYWPRLGQKIRPVVIARSENGKAFQFWGIPFHSTQEYDAHAGWHRRIEVEEDTCYGLCNKPSDVKAEIGTITPEKAKQ
ncbi:MAG: hypothetical protein IPM82_20390 [Saprospiraceae bacterium]|nr:hypothetical protein [Saprospiraceae bacterium]